MLRAYISVAGVGLGGSCDVSSTSNNSGAIQRTEPKPLRVEADVLDATTNEESPKSHMQAVPDSLISTLS